MNSTEFGEGDIFKLTLKLSIPTCLAQAVNVLYAMIDRMFIGHIPFIGDLALAGAGIAAPITTFISSFSYIIALGGAPIMAMKLGHNERNSAENILYTSLILLIIFSVVLTPLALIFAHPLLTSFGATNQTIVYALPYFLIYVLGTPFALCQIALASFLINIGNSKGAMICNVLGAITNIILDPIFIFTLNLGVRGAAIATIMSQALTAILLFLILAKSKSISIKRSTIKKGVIVKIFKLGASPFLIMATDSLLLILLNTILKLHGGANTDILITSSTIIQSYHLLVMNPLGGITGGSGGLLSYNYGAGNIERVKKSYRSIQLLASTYIVIIFALTYIAGRGFISLFTSDENIINVTYKYLKIFTLMIIPLSFQYNNVDTFTALGQVKYSLSLSLFRKAIFLISMITLPIFFNAEAVFFAEPISDLLAAITSTTIMTITLPKILKKRETQGLQL